MSILRQYIMALHHRTRQKRRKKNKTKEDRTKYIKYIPSTKFANDQGLVKHCHDLLKCVNKYEIQPQRSLASGHNKLVLL